MADFNNLPEVMRARRQWTFHRVEQKHPDKKPGRVPMQANGKNASSTDPATWCDFPTSVPKGLDGISYALVLDEGLVCIDIDGVRDVKTGAVEPWAEKLINEVASYTELSGSGTGYHIWVRATIPANAHPTGSKVEMYSHKKIMACTGELYDWFDDIGEHDLTALFARVTAGEFVPPELRKPTTKKAAPESGDASADDFSMIGAMHRKMPTASADALERAFAMEHPDRYAQRNREKKPHDGKNYFRYSIDRFLMRQEKATPGTVVAPASAPPAPVIISDMPEAVLDGFLGKVCRERMSDFPIAYAWPAILGIASVLVPRSSMRTPLYVDLDGGIGTGKSSVWERAFYLFGTPQEIIRLMAGSAEGLLERVGDIGGASRLVFVDEFAHLLEKSAIEHASFARVLTSIFYQDQLELTVAHRKRVSFNGRLSIVGGTVSEQFGDLFGSVSTGGLYDRFLFGRCPTGYQYLWRPNEVDGPPVFTPAAMTGDNSMFPKNERPVPVTVDADVYRERDRWIKELKMVPRVAEVVLRCAVICASWDGRTTLTAEMLGPALALAKYQMKAREVLKPNEGENTDAKCAHQIRTWLSANGGDGRWVSQRALDRGINARRHGPVVFKKCLDAMTFNGEIDREKHGRERVLRLCVDEETSASVIKKNDAVDDTSSPKSAEVSSRSLGRGCMYDQTIVNTEVINEVSSSAS